MPSASPAIRDQIESLLRRSGITFRRVNVIGTFIHIDTNEAAETRLRDLFGRAGFVCVMARSGAHLDGFDGFRIVFKLRKD